MGGQSAPGLREKKVPSKLTISRRKESRRETNEAKKLI